MISVPFQGKPFSITVIQVYALTTDAEEAEVERLDENRQDLVELTPKENPMMTHTFNVAAPAHSSHLCTHVHMWGLYNTHVQFLTQQRKLDRC